MPWRDYLGAIRPALTGSLVMALAVEIVKRNLLELPLSVRFGAEVLAGAAAYVLTLTVFHHDRLSVFWNFIRALRDPNRVSTVGGETARLKQAANSL